MKRGLFCPSSLPPRHSQGRVSVKGIFGLPNLASSCTILPDLGSEQPLTLSPRGNHERNQKRTLPFLEWKGGGFCF
jgi:hypothetical protein